LLISAAIITHHSGKIKILFPGDIPGQHFGRCNQITAGNGDYDSWREAFDKVMVYWKSTPRNYSAYAGMFTMNQDAKGLSTYIPRMSAPSLNTSYQQTEWYKVSGWADTGWYKN